VRLLLDEMFPPSVADGLRRRGIDAVAIQEMPSMRGLADPDVFVAAQLDGRCLVTENVADFVQVEAAWRSEQESPHQGLVLVAPRAFPRHHRQIVGRLVKALVGTVETSRPEPGTIAWLKPRSP
jgi:predicted nuclease of predicted toxin-antitoxin system